LPPACRHASASEADTLLADHVSQAGQGGERGHDDAGAKQPGRYHRPVGISGYPVGDVARKRPDEERDRERDQHRVKLNIEIDLDQVLKMTPKQIKIPYGLLGQPIIGNHNCPLLGIA
jgi:hypothetical protein